MKKTLLTIVFIIVFIPLIVSAEITGAGNELNQREHFDLKLLHEGAFPDIDFIEENDDLSIDIKSALYNRDSDIEVSCPEINSEKLVKIYENVINNSPKLYYVNGNVEVQKLNDCSYIIYPQYTVSNEISLFSAGGVTTAVNEILAQVDNRMSDVEKMLAVHDYILTHYEYDLTYSIYSAFIAPKSFL